MKAEASATAFWLNSTSMSLTRSRADGVNAMTRVATRDGRAWPPIDRQSPRRLSPVCSTMADAIVSRKKLKTSADADADAPPAKKRRTSTKKTAQTPGKSGMTKKELGDAIHDGLR